MEEALWIHMGSASLKFQEERQGEGEGEVYTMCLCVYGNVCFPAFYGRGHEQRHHLVRPPGGSIFKQSAALSFWLYDR
jgi:hypothetical protein